MPSMRKQDKSVNINLKAISDVSMTLSRIIMLSVMAIMTIWINGSRIIYGFLIGEIIILGIEFIFLVKEFKKIKKTVYG